MYSCINLSGPYPFFLSWDNQSRAGASGVCVSLCFNPTRPFRSRLGADLGGDVELPPLHPRRRSPGDGPAQRQPPGAGVVPVRGEDRVGDALRVTDPPRGNLPTQREPTLTN